MAHFLELLSDTDNLYHFVEVQLRSQPDLPEHVLGQVQWLNFNSQDITFGTKQPIQTHQ